jgi:hypothetical protein
MMGRGSSRISTVVLNLSKLNCFLCRSAGHGNGFFTCALGNSAAGAYGACKLQLASHFIGLAAFHRFPARQLGRGHAAKANASHHTYIHR